MQLCLFSKNMSCAVEEGSLLWWTVERKRGWGSPHDVG